MFNYKIPNSLTIEAKNSIEIPEDATPYQQKKWKNMTVAGDLTFSFIEKDTRLYKENKGGRKGKVFLIDPTTKQRIYVKRAASAKSRAASAKSAHHADLLRQAKNTGNVIDIPEGAPLSQRFPETLSIEAKPIDIPADATLYRPKFREAMTRVDDPTSSQIDTTTLVLYKEKKGGKTWGKVFFFDPTTKQRIYVKSLGNSLRRPVIQNSLSLEEKNINIPKDAILHQPKRRYTMVRVDDPTFSKINPNIQLYKDNKEGRNGKEKIFYIDPTNNQRIDVQDKRKAKKRKQNPNLLMEAEKNNADTSILQNKEQTNDLFHNLSPLFPKTLSNENPFDPFQTESHFDNFPFEILNDEISLDIFQNEPHPFPLEILNDEIRLDIFQNEPPLPVEILSENQNSIQDKLTVDNFFMNEDPLQNSHDVHSLEIPTVPTCPYFSTSQILQLLQRTPQNTFYEPPISNITPSSHSVSTTSTQQHVAQNLKQDDLNTLNNNRQKMGT